MKPRLLILLSIFLLFGNCKRDQFLHYDLNSISTIKIKVLDLEDTLSVSFGQYINIPRGSSSDNVLITSEGDYDLNFKTDRTGNGLITFSKGVSLNRGSRLYQQTIFTVPNDILTISIRHIEDSLSIESFDGLHSEINWYYYQKSIHLGYSDSRIPINENLSSRVTLEQQVNITDSILSAEMDFLENFSKEQNLPKWFIEFEKNDINYLKHDFILILPQTFTRLFNIDQLTPDNYYNFISKVDISNEKAITSASYFWFLNDYFLIDYDLSRLNHISGSERYIETSTHQLNKAIDVLKDEVKDTYLTSKLASLVARIDPAEFDSLYQMYKPLIMNSSYVSYIDSLRTHIPINLLMKGDKAPYFYLKDIEGCFKSINDFRGKMIYINFWYPGCKPCIESIPDKNALVEMFEKEPFELINICIRDSEERWLSTIEELNFKGTHLYAIGDWQEKLHNEYQIHSYPHYAFIDKNGNIIENFCKSPSQMQEIIKAFFTSEN